jgi:hypothetical protein
MPAGKTLRGNWAATGIASGALQYAWDPVAFGYRFASAPTGHLLAVGAAPTAECPGSLSTPEAAAGHFCAYTQIGVNVTSTDLCDPVANVCGSSLANRYGTTIRSRSTAAGLFYTWGTWAATSN